MTQSLPCRPACIFPQQVIWPRYLFERESSTDEKVQTTDEQQTVLEHGKAVRCAYCKTVITYQGNAESAHGKHVHHFINPGGYEFTIACYRRAWCKIVGLPMAEWSWFKGYTWQYALCPQCQEHLGWFYRNTPENSSFYGLILDRLIIDQSPENT